MKKEKAIEWKFDSKYNGKFVICNYITHNNYDNVYKAFDDALDAMVYMDDKDLWDDYYIYEVVDGYVYNIEF